METTERVKLFFAGEGDYELIMSQKYRNEIVRMAELLERAKLIAEISVSEEIGLVVPDSRRRCREWLADFERFQRGDE